MDKINISGVGDSGPVGGGKINANFMELVKVLFGADIWENGSQSDILELLQGLPTNNKTSILAAFNEVASQVSLIDDGIVSSDFKTYSINKLFDVFYRKVDAVDLVKAINEWKQEVIVLKEKLAGLNESISIKDTNGTEQFEVTDSVSFEENFTFDPLEKKIGYNIEPFQQLTSRFTKDPTAKNLTNITINDIGFPMFQTEYDLSLGKPFYYDNTDIRVFLLRAYFEKDIAFNSFSIENPISPISITYRAYLKPIGFSFASHSQDKLPLFSQTYTDDFDKINSGLNIQIPIKTGGFFAGGLSSHGVFYYPQSIDENNFVSYENKVNAQVKTDSDEAIDLTDCEFWLWMEVEVKYADSDNSGGNNTIVVRNSITNVFTIVEKI